MLSGATEPQGSGEHERLQVTPACVGSLVTVAVKAAVDPACTAAKAGFTTTFVPGTVTVALAVAFALAEAAAVIVTGRSPAGRFDGAV